MVVFKIAVVASENTRDYTREDPVLCDPHYLILRMSYFVSSCILNTMLITLVLGEYILI